MVAVLRLSNESFMIDDMYIIDGNRKQLATEYLMMITSLAVIYLAGGRRGFSGKRRRKKISQNDLM